MPERDRPDPPDDPSWSLRCPLDSGIGTMEDVRRVASPRTFDGLEGMKAIAMADQVVLFGWMKGFFRKGEPEVSWFSRFRNWMTLFRKDHSRDDPEQTDEFATLSSFTLLPGQLKLRVGVVSVRGNYREHNEDNFYVHGRRSLRHD